MTEYSLCLPTKLKAEFTINDNIEPQKNQCSESIHTQFAIDMHQALNLFDSCKILLNKKKFPCEMFIADYISKITLDIVSDELINGGYEIDFFWRTEKRKTPPIYDVTNYYMRIKNPLVSS
jgi:hypothetical protein